MLPFIGDFPCKLDNKGRFSMPSTFRKLIINQSTNQFVVRKNIYEPCLDVFLSVAWQEQVSFFKNSLNIYNQEQAILMREMFRGTAEVTLDNNGRILLPKRLLRLIDAKHEIVLAGQNDKIEIWSRSNYDNSALSGDELMNLTNKVLGKNEDER